MAWTDGQTNADVRGAAELRELRAIARWIPNAIVREIGIGLGEEIVVDKHLAGSVGPAGRAPVETENVAMIVQKNAVCSGDDTGITVADAGIVVAMAYA